MLRGREVLRALLLSGNLVVKDCSHPVRIDSADAERVYDLSAPFGSLPLLPFDSHPEGEGRSTRSDYV